MQYNNLPDACFSTNLMNGELIVIKKGESGYYPSNLSTNDPMKNRMLADAHNAQLGISKAQEASMVCGSMFGWEVPAADPQNYKEDGTPIIRNEFAGNYNREPITADELHFCDGFDINGDHITVLFETRHYEAELLDLRLREGEDYVKLYGNYYPHDKSVEMYYCYHRTDGTESDPTYIKDLTADERSVIRDCMRRNGLNDYIYEMAQMNVAPDDDTESRADFQCDQTEGFPTVLVVNWTKQQAWLELNASAINDGEDVSKYEQLCKDWGVRSCTDEGDYNDLLKQLGDEAYENAAFPADDPEIDMSF